MEHRLEGKTLVWVSADEIGVFTAATFKMLTDHFENQAVKVQLIRAENSDDVGQLMQRQVAGLVTLVLQQPGDIPSACKSLWRIRGRVGQPICACFISAEMIDHVPLLLESGAQIIVSQLDVWQRALARILSRAPLSKQGFHPLTAGLVDRLPWSNEDGP
jgi:hypothetical protein